MSFAVVRMAKMKSHDLKGIQFHNQREKESKTNLDIDKTKTHLNYEIHNLGPIDYNKQVKKIIDSQKIGERKTRKDAVLVNELLITSDKKFFEDLSPADEQRFFEESFKLFSKRYGEQNIAYATIHRDEKTPHMHLGVVPMKDGRLQGKNVFNRQELLWIQDEFPKHMQSLGFEIERGEKGSDREHIETQKFKAQTLDQKVKKLETELSHAKTDVKGIKRAVEYAKSVDDMEDAKTSLLDRKHVKVSVMDYEQLKTKARATEAFQSEVIKYMEKVVEEENKVRNLTRKSEVLQQKNNELKFENENLKRKNQELNKTINVQTKVIDYLQKTLEIIKASSLKFIGVTVNKMQEYVGISRGQSLYNSYDEQVINNEKLLQNIVPSDELEFAKSRVEGLVRQKNAEQKKLEEAEFKREARRKYIDKMEREIDGEKERDEQKPESEHDNSEMEK